MNDQEYERGELITDLRQLKLRDMIMTSESETVYRYICYDDETNSMVLSCRFGTYEGFDKNAYDYYYAIPKKKKVMKYLYEYFSNGMRYSDNLWYKDDEDFKSINSIRGIKFFNRLDWTATPFDE